MLNSFFIIIVMLLLALYSTYSCFGVLWVFDCSYSIFAPFWYCFSHSVSRQEGVSKLWHIVGAVHPSNDVSTDSFYEKSLGKIFSCKYFRCGMVALFVRIPAAMWSVSHSPYFVIFFPKSGTRKPLLSTTYSIENIGPWYSCREIGWFGRVLLFSYAFPYMAWIFWDCNKVGVSINFYHPILWTWNVLNQLFCKRRACFASKTGEIYKSEAFHIVLSTTVCPGWRFPFLCKLVPPKRLFIFSFLDFKISAKLSRKPCLYKTEQGVHPRTIINHQVKPLAMGPVRFHLHFTFSYCHFGCMYASL